MGPTETLPLPSIRYVPAKDGARIAMTCGGTGPTVLFVRSFLGSALERPGVLGTPWLRELLPHRRCAAYDPRGCGLSERQLHQVTLESADEELEAVVDALGPDPVTLLGFTAGAPLAVHFAALHPQRVSRLFLYGGFLRGTLRRGGDPKEELLAQAIRASVQVVADGDALASKAFLRMLNARMLPGATPEEAAAMDGETERRYSGEVALAYLAMLAHIDVSASAPLVRCPTLAFHAIRDQVVPIAEATRMAALIPGARLVALDDDNHVALASNPHWPRIVSELLRFLDIQQDAPADAQPALTSRQLEVLRLVGQGHTDKEIGRKLAISPRTVEMHVAHAMRSLGSKTRAEAAAKAARRGLTH